MAHFTTRIELHNATANNYTVLNTAMADAGFKRTIKADNGIAYKLPSGEYNKEGNFTADEVYLSAYTAALSTKCTFWILVTEAGMRKFALERVRNSE